MPDIEFPTLLQSEAIFGNSSIIKTCRVTVRWTGGTLRLWVGVSSDPTIEPTLWQEITGLTSGVEKNVTLTISGTWFFYKILKDYNTVIQGTQDVYGRWTAPAIRFRDFTEEAL